MLRPFHPLRGERGFTLVEVIVVVVIAGILVGLSYSGFSGMLARYRCQGALNRVAQAFKLAQMKAKEQSVRYYVNLGDTNDTLTITFDNDDCATSAATTFAQINLAREYPATDIVTPNTCNGIHFNPRGMPKTALGGLGNCSVRLTPRNKPTEMGNVTVSSMGRIQVATPDKWKY
jgi:prepilin-type N-terminal cleavage/methylation domain-containing protein